MENVNVANRKKVPYVNKIAFGIGMLANQMFPAALGIFMVVLVQDLGFPGWMWAAIYFFPRIFDCFTDPVMGFISDNTRSKWGRRRQYVFIGAILMGVAFVVMWQLYRENGLDYNFVYFMLWSFVFYLGITIFGVPYVAMGYEMSDDFHERTEIMAIAQWIGQWAWVIAPWFWVIMYDNSWFESADVATRNLAVWVGIICMVFAMVPALFIKGRSTLHDQNLATLSLGNLKGSFSEIFKGFVEAFRIKAFRKLCIATFFIYNTFYTVSAFSFFIVVYHLFNGNTEAAGIWPTLFGSLGALITTFIVIPIVAKMSKKMGKKKAFMWSQSLSVLGYILLWFLFIPGKPYMFIFALPFFSFGIGSLFTLMMSMTADVCDLDEMNGGKRREGIFGAIYWWMVKFGFAIAGGLSGLIISFVGLDPEAVVQPDGAVSGLRLFFSGVPIMGTLIAMWIMRDYDLTEAKAMEIKAVLDKRKSGKLLNSYYQTDKLTTLMHFDKNQPPPASHIDLTIASDIKIRSLFVDNLDSGIYGICFSPYTEGQNIGDLLSRAQIRRRMEVVQPHTSWVRSFSCTDGNEFIPEVAKELGLSTMVGAWIGDDKKANDREMENLVQLAQSGLVDVAVIGNEVLLRQELSEAELLVYMARFREAVPHVPVAYVDAYYQFYERPSLVEASDLILINCYPFWEGCHIDHAAVYLHKMYALVQQVAQGKPIIISETGWPNKGDAVKGAQPSDNNAMGYFAQVNSWAREEGVPLFYFSSFDESWKVHHEGDVGARWGLWDSNEQLKY